jgi:AcrR family transcriptional regulator
MQVNPEPEAASTESETRRKLKRAARRLFAERGIREVTVREIAREAGQRNQGAVAYHFGTKEALVTELLIDGAARIEARRRLFLADIEARGAPASVEQVVAAIVIPSAAFSDEDDEYGAYFNRFLLQLSAVDSLFVDRALEGRWNEGYQRCLAHLRRLMPNCPPRVQNRRFVFLGSYISGLLAQREAKMVDGLRHPTWRARDTLDDIVRTAAALIEADVPD